MMETAEHEARRRAADAANGCAQKPKPAGRPRDLVLAVLRRGPATKSEIREVNTRASAIAHVDWLVEAARQAERARCAKVLRDIAAKYTPGAYQWSLYLKAADAIEAP